MMYRFVSLLLVAVALTAFVAAPVLAEDKAKNAAPDKKKNTHEGTFVLAKDKGFTMKAGDKEHSHTLAADVKVVGPDGKAMQLTDIKAGQKIRVTTKEGDPTTVTQIEVLKDK